MQIQRYVKVHSNINLPGKHTPLFPLPSSAQSYNTTADRFYVHGHEDDEEFQTAFWFKMLHSFCDPGYVRVCGLCPCRCARAGVLTVHGWLYTAERAMMGTHLIVHHPLVIVSETDCLSLQKQEHALPKQAGLSKYISQRDISNDTAISVMSTVVVEQIAFGD